MQDGIEEAKRLLADYSARRAPLTTEREGAARNLLEQLKSLDGLGWHINIDTDKLAAAFVCDHAPAGRMVFLAYDTSIESPAWKVQVTEYGSDAMQVHWLQLDFNFAEGRFEAAGSELAEPRPAVLVVVEQVVDAMSK
jgi:hypothetical protein